MRIGLHVPGVGEARLNVAQCREGADHEQGADQQHQRHGHLRHHQHIARALACAARAGCAVRPRQCRAVARVRAYLNAGIEPNNNPENTESTKREAKRAGIERDLHSGAADRPGRWRREAEAGIRDPHGEHAANQPQHHALHQQLARNAPAARSQCGTDGKLLLARTPRAPAANSRHWCRRSASPGRQCAITTHNTLPTLPMTSLLERPKMRARFSTSRSNAGWCPDRSTRNPSRRESGAPHPRRPAPVSLPA